MKVWAVSDLHLGDGGPADEFSQDEVKVICIREGDKTDGSKD